MDRKPNPAPAGRELALDPSPRLPLIDAIRGVALAAMIVYHGSWDLFSEGLIGVDVGSDPAWRLFAHAIASTFLGLVGVSLVLASRRGFRMPAYLRRLARIVLAALAVSLVTAIAASWLYFPEMFIYFGILHAIAAASILAPAFLRLPSAVVLLAAVLSLLAPQFLRSEFFDTELLWWVGLSTVVAPTVDYVPVLPWFAATLVGIVIGRWVAASDAAFLQWRPKSGVGHGLVLAGRWSLAIYLVHQPILFGLANLAALALRRG